MPKIEPFEEHSDQYEEWFEENRYIYESELQAVKEKLPSGNGVEIGVGSGRFAAPLRVKLGVEPSRKMAEIARRRGIKVVEGTAEDLPFSDSQFDFVLMVTTICFVDDLDKSFKEAYRVLKPGGSLVIGFIDRESLVGKLYQGRDSSPFYGIATFYSVEEIIAYLKEASFKNFEFVQTIYGLEAEKIEPVEEGYGKGSFVVVKAMR